MKRKLLVVVLAMLLVLCCSFAVACGRRSAYIPSNPSNPIVPVDPSDPSDPSGPIIPPLATYTVSFDTADTGLVFDSIAVTYGQTYGELPTAPGYTFTWYTDAILTTSVSATDTVNITSNKTFYMTYTTDVIYTLNADETEYVVTGMTSSGTSDIVILDTYKGKQVTEIVDFAFAGKSSLKSAVIGANIETIGQSTFIDNNSNFIAYCRATTKPTGWNDSWIYSGYSMVWDFKDLHIDDSGITYHIYNTDTATVVDIADSSSAIDVVIPETVKGYSVTEIGEKAFYDNYDLISITIPSTVETIGEYAFYNNGYLRTVVLNEGLKSIGANAFYDCYNLTSITIPSTVETIGEYAFSYCYSLATVTISEGVKNIGLSAFYDCDGLTNITIPSTVEVIDRYAFYGCYYLETVTISEGVQGIGREAFYECDSLTSITIPSTVETIGIGAFAYCDSLATVTISEGVKNIDTTAFYYCSTLTEISIPDSVINIGADAFLNTRIEKEQQDGIYYMDNWAVGCVSTLSTVILREGTVGIMANAFRDNGILNISIPNTVKSIGDNAFKNCSYLENITIPDSVVRIGNYAFDYCYSLVTVTLGSNLETIGDYAFNGCGKLVNIKIPENVEIIGDYAFSDCDSLTSIAIPDSVVSIGYNAFSSCGYLTTVTLGSNLQTIGNYAFNYCNLTSITIPDSVISLGDYAFSNCSYLLSVTLGSNVETIGNYAFSNCSSLDRMIIPDSVTTIGEYAFNNTDIIFCESAEKPDGWNENWTNSSAIVIWGYVGTYYDSTTGLSFYLQSDNTATVFQYNNSWTVLEIPSYVGQFSDYAVTNIAYNTFYDFDDLTSVIIPDTVTNIGYGAFYGCNYLQTVVLSSNLETISNYAFYSCSSLTSISIPDSVVSIGEYVFGECYNLLTVRFGSNIQSIGNHAFYYCNGLTSIDIPDSVIIIGNSAFNYCYNLGSVKLGSGLETIDGHAFNYCQNLSSIVIGGAVETIGNYAFYSCDSISTVYYVGNNEEWSTITIGSNNGYLTGATLYYYSEEEPALNEEGVGFDGNYWRYVDDVPTIWTMPSRITISAIDNSLVDNGISFTASGSWTEQSDGSLKSTSIGNSASTSYTLTMTSSGTFSYSYKTSTESGYDKLTVYKNGSATSVSGVSGIQSSFTDISISVVVGDVIKFTYAKDVSQSRGDDAVYIKLNYDVFPKLGDIYSVSNSELPSTLTTVTVTGEGKISNRYFSNCTYLTTIIIGEGVVSISDNAFDGCVSLTSVYYCGSYSDWSELTIGENNEYLLYATIYYYSEEEPTDTSYNYWHYVDGVATPW